MPHCCRERDCGPGVVSCTRRKCRSVHGFGIFKANNEVTAVPGAGPHSTKMIGNTDQLPAVERLHGLRRQRNAWKIAEQILPVRHRFLASLSQEKRRVIKWCVVVSLLLASVSVQAKHVGEGVSSPVQVSPRLNYTAEFLGATSGDDGVQPEFFGLAYASVDVVVPAPGSIASRMFHASALWLHGDPVSDQLGENNGVSNIAGVSTLRLFHAWFEQRSDSHTVRVGKFDVDEHYMVSDAGALFTNSGFGAMATATTNMPLPTYPMAGLGALMGLPVGAGSQIFLAVFDGDVGSEDDEKDGLGLGSSGVGGVLLAAELRREYDRAWGPGTAKVGGMLHTGEFETFDATGDRDGNGIVYAVLDQVLWQQKGRLVTGFLRASAAPFSDRNLVTYQFDGGLIMRDPLSRGGAETLGLAVLNTPFSDDARDDAQLVDASSETVVELTLLVPLGPNLTVQPSFQWVSGGTLGTGDDDALVAGIRLSMDL